MYVGHTTNSKPFFMGCEWNIVLIEDIMYSNDATGCTEHILVQQSGVWYLFYSGQLNYQQQY